MPLGTAGVTSGTLSGVKSLTIGPEAFLNPFSRTLDPSRLSGTLYHEGVHVGQFNNGSIWNMSRGAVEAQAYGRTLVHSSSLELSTDVKSYYKLRYMQEAGAK